MKKYILSLFCLVLALSFVATSFACTPCPKELTFNETVKETNLIIIGKKIFEGPSTKYDENPAGPASPTSPGGPDWIKVAILEVLKGETNQKEITVNSWNGMCAYGIIVDDGTYVILLEKGGDQYYEVHAGCGAKTFLVENDKVGFYGEKISVDDFVSKLGSDAKRRKIQGNKDTQSANFYYIFIFGGLVSISLLLIFITTIILLRNSKEK